MLEFLTPFHIYDARKSNFLQKTTEQEKETFKHSRNYAEIVPLLKIFTLGNSVKLRSVKRNLKRHFNKVSFTNDKNKKVTARLSVNDIGIVTREKVLVNKKQFKRKKTLINATQKLLYRIK